MQQWETSCELVNLVLKWVKPEYEGNLILIVKISLKCNKEKSKLNDKRILENFEIWIERNGFLFMVWHQEFDQ